jgi:hypothetical protein
VTKVLRVKIQLKEALTVSKVTNLPLKALKVLKVPKVIKVKKVKIQPKEVLTVSKAINQLMLVLKVSRV